MISTRKNKAILMLILALVMSVLAPFVMQVNNYAKAGGEVKTVSEVTFGMDKGASIYNGSGEYASKKGVKFSASMSEQDYIDLTNNVGVDKLYSSLMFGVIIAPSSYETTYGKFNETNLFGIVDGQKSGAAIYDWAEWDGEKWNYSGTKTRVINIERNELSIDTGKAVCKGSITTILDENLLKAFKGVCYIVAEKNDGGYDCAFATENDNVRTVVYVAQQRQQAIKDEIAKLDPTENAQAIAELNAESNSLGTTYIKDQVTNQTANYTINHYVKKPVSGYALIKTETKTAQVNSVLSVSQTEKIDLTGVNFDSSNVNNSADSVVYAQNKSVVNLYYSVEYKQEGKTKVLNISENNTADYSFDGVEKLYDAELKEIALTDSGVANATVKAWGKGEKTLYAYTEMDGFVKLDTVLATHVISNADEFVDFFNSFNTNAICTNTKYWYAVVINDIDMSAKTLPSKSGWWYCGTFNGLGHEVSGIKPRDGYGMFGGLTNTAVIENLAFTNISTVYNLISNDANGTLRNLFVQGEIKFDGSTRRGVAVLNNSAKVENCIVVAKTPTSGTAANYAFKYNGGTIAHGYLVSECLQGFTSNGETTFGVLKSNTNELVADTTFIADISAGATNGWSKYWQNTSLGLYFGDTLVAMNSDIEPTETKEMKYLNAVEIGDTGAVSSEKTHIVDLKAMLGKTPNLVMIDSEKVTASDTITLSSSDYEYGTTHTITFGAGNTVIEQPFMFATHVISNADEFVDFFNSFNTSAICTNTKYWYAVVINDIDMSAKTLPSKSGWWYCGTFNGLGHEVSGIKPINGYGMFGGLTNTAVIENLAFTNISTVYNLISNDANGTLRNLFVQGEIKFDGGTRRGVAVLNNSAKVENCIVVAKTPTSGTAANYAFKYNGGTIAHGYLVSECLQGFASDGETTFGVLKSNTNELVADTTFIADISASATNGWSEYWKLTGDATNGYTLKFGNATVGSTVNA